MVFTRKSKDGPRQLSLLDQCHVIRARQLIKMITGECPDKALRLHKPIEFEVCGTVRICGKYDFRSSWQYNLHLPDDLIDQVFDYRLIYAIQVTKTDGHWQPLSEFNSLVSVVLRKDSEVNHLPVNYLVAWQNGFVRAVQPGTRLRGCSFFLRVT